MLVSWVGITLALLHACGHIQHVRTEQTHKHDIGDQCLYQYYFNTQNIHLRNIGLILV